MSTDPRFHKIMKAVALGATAEARELGEGLSPAEHGRLYTFGTAVMAICLEHRFKDDSSAEAIRQFVDSMRANYANARQPLKFFAIEGVIRGFAGDDHLLDEISAEDQMNAQYPVIRKIVAESSELQDGIDDLLREADELVAEWDSEDE